MLESFLVKSGEQTISRKIKLKTERTREQGRQTREETIRKGSPETAPRFRTGRKDN